MEYLIHLGVLVSIYAILALSLNLVMGYTGIISLTHAAFFGFGAYTTAILSTRTNLNFFVTVLVGMLLTSVLSLLIGRVLSKFRGDFVALGSVAFNVIVWSILINGGDFTRGPLGIPGIPRPEIFGFSFSSNSSFLILAIACLLLVFFAARFIERSSFGRVLKAIREDEEALQVFGYRVVHYKLAVFVIGACMAAVAGSLYASYITFVDPSTFTVTESIFMISIIILGGLASNKGAVIGAVVLTLLPEALRFVGFPADIAAQTRQAVYGLMLILLMLYRPQGFVGEYKL
ncbi:MAG: branched-chain amino acid ABC transporter permease [Candidatus Taylorbacteria bacterium]|nr:branched-chain amino acid ABC transporter permease [Candidatus Taylorbacteria bacterium]